MNFARSRLSLVALVLSVPVLQVSACGQKDRQYSTRGAGGEEAPSGGGIDASDGGDPAAAQGGDSSKGASSPGGALASEGGSGAMGGTDTGEAGGGMVIDGGGDGAGGEPTVDPTCMPTGKEVCGDGVDNDCDGETDCLVLRGQFPPIDNAAPGADVLYTFTTPHETASFQCRAGKGIAIATPWGECAKVTGGAVSPITAAQSSLAANNGVWTTEVRLAFPDGGTSAKFRRQVYIHNSMHGAARCSLGVTDAALFAAAKPNLQDAGEFDTSTVKAPFISLDFDPPVDTTFSVAATDGNVKLMSLRRRFSFSADNHFLLITRNYTSQKAGGMGCTAIEKRVHRKPGSWINADTMAYQRCSAIVLNKKGAGYCLSVSGSAVTAAEHIRADNGVQVQDPTYSPKADNFAWRKLSASGEMAPGISANFSKKCAVANCGNATTLYLPDVALFSYWGG
jgi:hypothetical protein